MGGSLDASECILAAPEGMHLEAVESKVGWDKHEEEGARLRQENVELKTPPKQGGA